MMRVNWFLVSIASPKIKKNEEILHRTKKRICANYKLDFYYMEWPFYIFTTFNYVA